MIERMPLEKLADIHRTTDGWLPKVNTSNNAPLLLSMQVVPTFTHTEACFEALPLKRVAHHRQTHQRKHPNCRRICWERIIWRRVNILLLTI